MVIVEFFRGLFDTWKPCEPKRLYLVRVSVNNTPPSSSRCSLCCTLILPYCAANSEFHTFSLEATSPFVSPASLGFRLNPDDKKKCVKSTFKNLLNSTLAVFICLLNNAPTQFTAATGAAFVWLYIVPSIMDSKQNLAFSCR